MYTPHPNRKTKASCHSDRPHHAKGFCYQCYKQQYRKNNLETCRELEHKRGKRFRDKNRSKLSETSIKYRYGLSSLKYEDLLRGQNNRCKICLVAFDDKTVPCVDHNHQTGEIRGLLCRSCNVGIGFLTESQFKLARAIAYLNHYEDNSSDSWINVRFVDLPEKEERLKDISRFIRA